MKAVKHEVWLQHHSRMFFNEMYNRQLELRNVMLFRYELKEAAIHETSTVRS